ncbi:MAG: nitrite reductase (NAD(P)H), partial [Chitinophagaceae bacterium]
MKVIVIGNGMVSHKLCEKLRARVNESALEIEVFGEETRPAYDRVHLSEYFSGKSSEALELAGTDWYQANNISLHLGDPIRTIDRSRKTVTSHHGVIATYDILVIATGSSAFVPAIPGIDKKGVFVYRTIEDLELMQHHARTARSGAVIGGGLLGLEAAKAMLDLGIADTTIIEFASRLMPRQIDEAASGILIEKLSALGLTVATGKNTSNILGNGQIERLSFTDGSELPCDMLVISAGIQPRDELAKAAGLPTGPRGGIIVDDELLTADQNIFAIGECALHKNMIYGLVAPGYEMAGIVADKIASKLGDTVSSKHFTGFDMSTKLKLIGIDVASFGDPFINDANVRTLVYEDNLKGIYKRINISGDGKALLGGILIGDAADYNMLLQTCKNNVVLPPEPGDLIFGARGDKNGKTSGGPETLPDEAIICSCEGVSKSDICNAVLTGGCENIDALKKCTKAGTGCGGCVPMVKDLLVHSMKTQGKYIRNVLCEHFAYSRQELFDLIKVHGLKSYNEVLDKLGKGDGCELCKPPVASILASLWGEMILKKGNDAAQDSNDRFLANIQKGGTYSVVP